jgi:hypothetical protein
VGFAQSVNLQEKIGEDKFVEITKELTKSVEMALEWLSGHQNSDGSWGHNVKIATTSLACLAFMAGGHFPGRGKYGEHVKQGLAYILKHCSKSGYIYAPGDRSRMHGHGYALLFLSEIYGTCMKDVSDIVEPEELKQKIQQAIRLSEKAQSHVRLSGGKIAGGWTYTPNSRGDEGSVTITQVQALRAARNAGFVVNEKTIKKAINYIRACISKDGSVVYSISWGARGRGTFALTAAGIAVAMYLGLYEDAKVKKGLKFIKKFKPGRRWSEYYFFYSHMYAAQAMFFSGGKDWQEWWPAIRDLLIQRQSSDGSWAHGEARTYGKAFSTAIGALILQIPYRYLSIFQSPKE